MFFTRSHRVIDDALDRPAAQAPNIVEQSTVRLMFKMGDVFPADDPIATFLVAVSMALNDLVTVTKWMVGGDQHVPDNHDVGADEQHYLLRLSIAQLYEVRESISHAQRNDRVQFFLASLSPQARADLDRLMNANVREDSWVRATVSHVRNQTNHYGGRWNWDDLTWAMRQVAEDVAEIEVVSPRLAGLGCGSPTTSQTST
jgi:hypothetical protein